MKRNILLFILLLFILNNCTSTRSGNAHLNRDISIKVLSGNVYLNISGHISENVYLNIDHYSNNTFFDSPIVFQGKETINQNIILYETQEFKYTLTIAEVVIVNVKSIDDNDAIIVIFEYGKKKEYKIDGQNRLGQIITFKN